MSAINKYTAFAEPLVHAGKSGRPGKYGYRMGMGMMPSAEFYVHFDDFDGAVGTNAVTGSNGQAYTAIIDTGATLTKDATAASTLGTHGVLKIASDGTSEGAANYKAKDIQILSGKRFFIEALVRSSNVAEVDLQFGLSVATATTNPEDLWTTTSTDLITFGLLAGSAYPTMLSDLSNSGTSAQAQTNKLMVNNTWHTLAIYCDGSSELSGWLDGDRVLVWSSAFATTVPVGVLLYPFFGARTGATAGNLSYIDYIRWAMER